MHITFEAIGLKFEAVVQYSPGEPANFVDPGYDSECEIERLFVLHDSRVSGAFWLLSSDVAEQIHQAAHAAADEAWPSYVEDRKADAAIDRLEDQQDWSAA